MSATEASQTNHVDLRRLEVFSMTEVRRVSADVEQRGDERSQEGTPNNGSAGGAV